ncbi:MAG: apolipoprotein N-acyltransferase [Pseudomonadota bacterium]
MNETTQPSRLKKWQPWLLAVLSGVLGFLGYAGFDQFYLEWLFLVPLLWVIRDATPRRAFFLCWVMGTVGHSGGFYWVAHMMHDFAYMPWAVGVLATLLMGAVNALSIALWGLGLRRIQQATGWSTLWLAPLLWTAIEVFYPFIFPNYLGASQYKVLWLTQIADVTGILGVTFVLVWINAALFGVVEWRLTRGDLPRLQLAIFAVGLIAVLGYGAVRLSQVDAAVAQAPKITVGLVQSNLGASAKHRDRQGFLRLHHEMSTELQDQHKVDLIVWPEGAYNAYLDKGIARLTSRVMGTLTTPLLFGALTVERVDGQSRRYNSALLADAERKVLGSYDKHVLVPFGEYIPLGDTFPFLYKWSPNSARYYHGQTSHPLPFGRYLLSVNICYEDLFPGLVRMLMTSDGAGERLPHAIVNITNDSWYGDTVEPTEHLVLASFRAIEHRRPLIRSTNTGLSAIVDPVGRFTALSGQWTRENVVGEAPMMSGRTVYSLVGNLFGWLCLLAAAFCLGQAEWDRRRGSATLPAIPSTAKASENPTAPVPAAKRKKRRR